MLQLDADEPSLLTDDIDTGQYLSHSIEILLKKLDLNSEHFYHVVLAEFNRAIVKISQHLSLDSAELVRPIISSRSTAESAIDA